MSSMPQPTQDDQNDNAAGEVVLGVDTHKDVHAAAVINPLGVLLSSETFPATATGYQALLAWAGRFGTVRRAGVECTGSYGAALARHLRTAGVEVIEVNAPDKATRRRRGKTDTLDAEAAARAVLSGRASATAKAGDGPVEMLRMFKLAKASAVKARTQTINQLKAVLVAADPELREALCGLSNLLLIRRCTQLEVDTPCGSWPAASWRSPTRSATCNTRSQPPSPATAPRCSLAAGSAPTTPPPCSSPLATTPTGCAARPASRPCAASAPWKHPQAGPAVAD